MHARSRNAFRAFQALLLLWDNTDNSCPALVGPQVRKLRYRAGISQEEMAARCQRAGLDISRSTLAQIEIRFRYVSDEELYILARALNVSPNDLYPAEMRKPFSK